MKYPQATRADHERFCRAEGWTAARNARGSTGTHHITFKFVLPDGRVLRTRISHPPDHSTYSPSIWSHILRDQLQVSEVEFWACVHDGVLPSRGPAFRVEGALPADLAHLLIKRVGVPETEVAAMTKEEAIARLNAYWAGT